jgi:hypothetical protein
MKQPTRRYGNPEELRYYTQGMPVELIAKRLKRTTRTVRDWLAGTKKMPFWVPELLRLQRMEQENMLRQMNIPMVRERLGLVAKNGQVIPFTANAGQERLKEPAISAGSFNRGSIRNL